MSKPSDCLIHYYLQTIIHESNLKPSHNWARINLMITYIIKVDQPLMLNGLMKIRLLNINKHLRREKLTKKQTYVDAFVFLHLFFCYCTSTEGTYHHRFGKCTLFPIFRLGAKYYHLFKQTVKIAHNIKNPLYWILFSEISGKYLEPW